MKKSTLRAISDVQFGARVTYVVHYRYSMNDTHVRRTHDISYMCVVAYLFFSAKKKKN